MSAMQKAMEAERAYRERVADKVLSEEGGVKPTSMTLEEYEEKRLALEQQMEDANEREKMHKERLAFNYQKERKEVQSKIGNLKKRHSDLLRQYRQDKMYVHAQYRQEKQNINEQMHLLRMQYLTLNNISTNKKQTSE